MRSEWKGGWGLGLPETWPHWAEEGIVGGVLFAIGLLAASLLMAFAP